MKYSIELEEALGVVESPIRHWKGWQGKPDLRRERHNGVEAHHAAIYVLMEAQAVPTAPREARNPTAIPAKRAV